VRCSTSTSTDDILAILYTSDDGKPKGATITHRQALANHEPGSARRARRGQRAAHRAQAERC
jgi:acyl-coenzyme A synthetase/AMP-(fatty) acid ligase